MDDKICLYPFIHAFVTQLQTDSQYRLNCCSVNNASEMHGNGSLIESYNSEYFRDLRKAHAEGRGLDHPHCRVCKESETRSGTSPRIMNNQHFLKQLEINVDQIVEKMRSNDFRILIEDIKSLEYMPSNYCNYACIMCSSFASSQRFNIERRLGETHEYKFGDDEPSDFRQIVNNVQLLGFAGGETLLQPRVLAMIDDLISKGATDKKISILTNISKYDPVLYSKLEKFQNCFVTFSIDGTGKVGEYQRRFSSWKQISSNLLQIRKNHPKIEYVVNYVVTAVSAVGIPDFLDWAYHNDIQDIIFSPVKNRRYLSIDALPDHIIDRLKTKMKKIGDLSEKSQIADFQAVVRNAMNFYESHEHDAMLLQKFRKRMLEEDATRTDNLKLYDIIPDLDGPDGR